MARYFRFIMVGRVKTTTYGQEYSFSCRGGFHESR